MSYQLSDLLNDCRLDRLFSADPKDCALQLWILQIKYQDATETRVLYGRLVPYNFSNNTWGFSDKDDSQFFEPLNARVSVTRLHLYANSSKCRELLRLACDGISIDYISKELDLKLDKRISKNFGNTILIEEGAIFRPAVYLLNSNADLRGTISSPHSSAGAISASICKSNKASLLFFLGRYYPDLTMMIIKKLDADTGMSFGSKDVSRLGDMELLVFPTLGDNERNLLDVRWTKDDEILVRLTTTQLANFEHFQFHVSIENNDQILESRVAFADKLEEDLFECKFKLNANLNCITDSAKVDVFAFKKHRFEEGHLCCSWRMNYIREINLSMHLISDSQTRVRFDWLEKTTTSKMHDRLSQAVSISAKDITTQNTIGGRVIDKWVLENQALNALFSQIHPSKSEGGFFPKYQESYGEGRLQFVEWFKELAKRNRNNHIAIFDPYFADAGLGMLILSAYPDSEYTIFRSIPKPKDAQTCNSTNMGIDNLTASFERNRRKLQQSIVKVYGLKEGELHDRYILVIGKYRLPVEGFHLSNSFQSVAKKFPLLATPIPMDVLHKTLLYLFEILEEAEDSENTENGANSISLLLDSRIQATNIKLFEPLSILDNALAGTVFSVWLKEPGLKGIYGDELKVKMVELGIFQGESLHDIRKEGFLNCLNEMEGELSNFHAAWEILGDILANTPAGDSDIDDIGFSNNFLSFLIDFLSKSFLRESDYEGQNTTVIDPKYFKKSLTELIRSPTRPQYFIQLTRSRILSWAEFYAVKYLWRYSPSSLLGLAERETKRLADDYAQKDTVRLALLEQVISEISTCLEFQHISAARQGLLIKSELAIFNWLGWNFIESQLLSSDEYTVYEEKLSVFPEAARIQFIGWALSKNASNPNNLKLYENSLLMLRTLLPPKLTIADLIGLIYSSTENAPQPNRLAPQLFCTILQPLINEGRASYEDVCEIWFRSLIYSLEDAGQNLSFSFSSEREGEMTNLSSYLWTHTNSEYQNQCIVELKEIIKIQQRVIRQPLASASNWTQWDCALNVSLWILVFSKLSRYYLNTLQISAHVEPSAQ